MKTFRLCFYGVTETFMTVWENSDFPPGQKDFNFV